MLVGAAALVPGIGEAPSRHASDGPSASAPAAPAGRSASDPRIPVREPAALARRASRVPFGIRVVEYAERLVGVRYLYGGSSPSYGFDCSGFVRYVYAHFGISLAHSSYAQFASGRSVGRGALEPGDLVFFDDLGHVGIYIGNGRFIHAPHTGTRVRIETLAGWYSSRFNGARRIDDVRPGKVPTAVGRRKAPLPGSATPLAPDPHRRQRHP
jgi:cell wall-associated NlpC family hydrolase